MWMSVGVTVCVGVAKGCAYMCQYIYVSMRGQACVHTRVQCSSPIFFYYFLLGFDVVGE